MNPIYKFELNRPTVNLLNPKTVVSGLLSTSNGQITSSTIYRSSDFIPVTPGTNYKLCDKDTFTSIAAPAACFYTANKTFISGSYGIANTPSNAAFIRVSFQGSGADWGVFPSNVSYWSDYVTPQAFPIYKDDLAKEFELQQNQEFFRAKLSGKLTFVGPDYDWIVGRVFDFQYLLTLFISYDAGRNWAEYWRGTFWKTDCEFDGDAKTVTVTPTVQDQYNDVLAGMEKEYNLIDLAPEIVPVKADKRPMVQVYVPGQSVVGCFLSGMWWEQEAEPENDETKLVNDFHFSLNKVMTIADVSGSMSPQLSTMFLKQFSGDSRFNPREQGTTEFTATGFKLVYGYGAGSAGSQFAWYIVRTSDNVTLWRFVVSNQTPPLLPVQVTLTPVSGSGATGDVTLYVHDLAVYSRLVCDTETIEIGSSSLNTYEIPADDIVENNRNYRRAIGYYFPNTIIFSTTLVSTPTQWGLYQPGQYYYNPADNPIAGLGEAFPVARNSWGRVSIWYVFSFIDWIVEESARAPFTLRDAFPLSSVISVLLGQIAPGITHAATTDYSAFLYGTNPISYIAQTLLITPKSNIISAGYDQPAQKAPITLKRVMDMLRDCFRCYWFIDAQNRFRIEHITYFMRGGTYSGTPVVGIDLTAEKVTRNNKEWAFARNQYQFDKPNMAARYQFGWMDDVTQLFEGYPIDIISKYVNPDNIEEISVSQFTSDIDYILLNPGAISKDGFVLLSTIQNRSFQNSTYADSSSQTRFECVINGNFAAGETIGIYMSDSSNILQNNNASIRDDTDNSIGIARGGRTVDITLPRNTNKIVITKNVGGIIGNGTVSIIIEKRNVWELPYINFNIDGTDHILQNAYVAFVYLQRYYAFDMPAYQYEINGEPMYAFGIKKLKTQQLRFPVLNDPDLVQLVKTNIGNGTIQKLSVNLSSRNANVTLKYDTE